MLCVCNTLGRSLVLGKRGAEKHRSPGNFFWLRFQKQKACASVYFPLLSLPCAAPDGPLRAVTRWNFCAEVRTWYVRFEFLASSCCSCPFPCFCVLQGIFWTRRHSTRALYVSIVVDVYILQYLRENRQKKSLPTCTSYTWCAFWSKAVPCSI